MVSLHTWVLAGALLATGLTVLYLLQPPSADALYARITAATADGTTRSLENAESLIDEYLRRYSVDFHDPRCEQLRQYQREIELSHMRRDLERQAKGEESRKRLLPIERAYLEAIHDSAQDPYKALTKLRALVDLYRDWKDSSGSVGKCLELVRRQIEQLRQYAEKDKEESVKELERRLEQAEELHRTDPDTAKAIREAVIKLYQDKPWAASAVQQARKALQASPSERGAGAKSGKSEIENPKSETNPKSQIQNDGHALRRTRLKPSDLVF